MSQIRAGNLREAATETPPSAVTSATSAMIAGCRPLKADPFATTETKMTKTLLMAGVAASVLLTAALPALADGGRMGGDMGMGPMGGPADFATLDTNADGQLTLEEMMAEAGARFAAADADGDGGLSAAEIAARAQAEFAARIEQHSAMMVQARDANGDGLLQADEMGPQGGMPGDRIERMFGMLDTDEDGQVSQAEYDAAMALMAEMGQRLGRHGGGDGGHHGGGWFGFGRNND